MDNESNQDFAETLGAEIGGRQAPDGTWVCACGKRCGSSMFLYMHRRHDPCTVVEQ